MSERRKILIAGAGLGGLAVALSLLRAGHEVEIYEQAPELGEVGAGIQISANAAHVLIDLGLGPALDRVAVHPQRLEFRLSDTAEVINSVPLGQAHADRFGAPYWQLYRPDLHGILAEAVRQLAPEAVHLNATVTGYSEGADGVQLSLVDGRQISGDILIGADGIKSVIRAAMHGEEPPNFTGQVAYRGLIPAEKLPENFMPPIFVNWMGPRTHMVVYWVRDGAFLNFVGCTSRPDWTDDGWAVKAPWADLKATYQGFHAEVQTIVDAMDRDQVYCWAMNNRPRLPYWSTGRVTLLGDACHPTIPYMAQGAVMAIEDAAILTRTLEAEADSSAALKLYEDSRIDRTARIVDESTEHAKLYQHDSHDAFRVAFAAKNPGKDRARWLYNYNPTTIPIGRQAALAFA